MSTLQVIPAIDLAGGKVVRLLRGIRSAATVYSDDPLAVAEGYAQQGANLIHVVDLDGAFDGAPRHVDLVAKIARRGGPAVQWGGGLRSHEDVARILDSGADRVVIGTRAIIDSEFLESLFDRWGPQRIVVSVDARDQRVATGGWVDELRDDLGALARRLASAGARRLVYTDVLRDGTLEGPNIDTTRKVCEAAGVPVIASGGVSSLADLRELSKLTGRGLEGAIVGRALYEGIFQLSEAIEEVAKR